MLLFVRIPRPAQTADGQQAKGSIWKEMRFGWDYILARKGLLSLLVFFLVTNFVVGVMQPLFVPLVLDNWDAGVMGYLSTILGLGALVGTLVMSAWGGGKRKIYPLLISNLVCFLFLAGIGLRTDIPLIAVCGFAFMFTGPIGNACSQAIWMAKVAPDVQGRVFAVRRAIAWSAQIVAPLLAAPLADYVFKPAMADGGALAPLLGPVFGFGAARGVGVMITCLGLVSVAITLAAFFVRPIRRIELDLPDHVLVTEATTNG
jgi:DHA3 family macrolide efflux protein-like MFS transporter